MWVLFCWWLGASHLDPADFVHGHALLRRHDAHGRRRVVGVESEVFLYRLKMVLYRGVKGLYGGP